jgi:AraC-like DNA-binding protein
VEICFLLLYNPSEGGGSAEVGKAMSIVANEELDLLPDSGEAVCPRVVSFSSPHPVLWGLHEAFEVLVGVSGQYDARFRRLTLRCRPGDVLLCSSWEPHGIRITTPRAVLLSVLFKPDFLGEEMLGELPWPTLFAALPGDRPKVAGEEMRRQALAVACEMSREVEERHAGWQTALRLGVYRLLFLIGREWTLPARGRTHSALPTPHPARVGPAVKLVQARGGRPVLVEEAAAACHLSPSQFAYVFRHSIGVSFGRFVLRSRLTCAARLLLAGDDSIDAIAQQLQFTDRSHLHHAFQKRYGCTPAQYRAGSRQPYAMDEDVGREVPMPRFSATPASEGDRR